MFIQEPFVWQTFNCVGDVLTFMRAGSLQLLYWNALSVMCEKKRNDSAARPLDSVTVLVTNNENYSYLDSLCAQTFAKRREFIFFLHCIVFFVFHQTTQQINFVVSFFFFFHSHNWANGEKRFNFHDALVIFAASKCVDRSKMTAFRESEMAATAKLKNNNNKEKSWVNLE